MINFRMESRGDATEIIRELILNLPSMNHKCKGNDGSPHSPTPEEMEGKQNKRSREDVELVRSRSSENFEDCSKPRPKKRYWGLMKR